MLAVRSGFSARGRILGLDDRSLSVDRDGRHETVASFQEQARGQLVESVTASSLLIAPRTIDASIARKASMHGIHNLGAGVQQEKLASLLDAPDWEKCRKRATTTIRHGVMLAHNIAPSGEAYARLAKVGDPRTVGFGSNCRTANSWIGVEGGLALEGEPRSKRQTERLKQRVAVADFVKWAVQHIDNPHMTSEFRALAEARPTSSDAVVPNVWDRSVKNIRVKHGLNTPGAVTKRLQSIAGLLVALAVNKHGLKVSHDGQKSSGTYADFEKVTRDAGFGPVDGQTIADAFALAVDLAGRDVVMAAIEARAAPAKS